MRRHLHYCKMGKREDLEPPVWLQEIGAEALIRSPEDNARRIRLNSEKDIAWGDAIGPPHSHGWAAHLYARLGTVVTRRTEPTHNHPTYSACNWHLGESFTHRCWRIGRQMGPVNPERDSPRASASDHNTQDLSCKVRSRPEDVAHSRPSDDAAHSRPSNKGGSEVDQKM